MKTARIVLLLYGITVFVVDPTFGDDRGVALGSNLESILAAAKRLSPVIAASILDADAAAYLIGAAGVQADPTINLQAWDVSNRSVGQTWVGVEQTFRIWGKTDLEKGIASADAEAARHQSRAIELDLTSRIKTAYAQYSAAHQAVELSKSLQKRVDQIADILRLRYGASSINQQEVIKAEIEAANIAADVVRREGEEKSAAVRLNALIGRKAQAPLAIPGGFPVLKTKMTLDSVQSLARSRNPLIAATNAQEASASKTKELTDLNYYPDITTNANIGKRSTGETNGMFLFGFKVPLQYEAKDAQQRAAGATLNAVQARNDALRIRLDGEVAETWYRLESIRKALKIYEERQLQSSKLSVETARKGYEAGTVDLPTLLEAERRQRAVELDIIAIKIDEQTRYADLERLAGGSL